MPSRHVADIAAQPGYSDLVESEAGEFRANSACPFDKLRFSPALVKNLLMPLFLMGCFPRDFQEGKRPIEASGETAH